MDMHYKLRKVMNLKMTLDLMVQLLSKPQLVNLTLNWNLSLKI